ncbi:MAG: hypothetical protein D6806_05800, partial [Deltaproteobacteria bacterium]
MTDWESIAGLRVIGRLSDMLKRRWHLGLSFAEPDGTPVKGEVFSRLCPNRPVCLLVQSTKEGRLSCDRIAERALERWRGDLERGAQPIECHAGLVEYFVPLEVEGQLQGLVLAGGALCQRMEEHQRRIALKRGDELGLGSQQVTGALERSAVLTPEDEKTISELLELVVEEILVYR